MVGIGVVLIAALAAGEWVSPVAIVGNSDAIFVGEATGTEVLVLNPSDGAVARKISLPEPLNGLALSPDGKWLCATSGEGAGMVRIVNAETGEVRGTVAAGHTPGAPVFAPDGGVAYVCNRFTNDVSVVDVAAMSELARVPVLREPTAAALTPDGKTLFVSNLLPNGPANGDYSAASVSVIDTAARQVATTVPLPNGSTDVRGVCVAPDGKYAYVVHVLSRYQLPTTQLERGWMNTNAVTIVDVASHKILNTVLLDDVDYGAANPYAAACTPDGKYLCVTHAGSQELSILDLPALHAKLDKVAAGIAVDEVASKPEDVPVDLGFLVDVRTRVRIKGNGPRAVALFGTTAWIANYFTDSVDIVDFADLAHPRIRPVPLNPAHAPTQARRGEMLFHDAQLCFQQWQSCASCHPDARVDALNWDLLNDGLGNPKNTKSMLLAHQTPPAMSLGVRATAEMAVRAGIKFIQFAVRPEEDSVAIDEYLKSMKPTPSPRLTNGQLNESAQRGKDVYAKAGCAACHPEPLFTDLKQYDVGTVSGLDAGRTADTPTLVECWRTAPYLHDGRAATMLDVFKSCNAGDKHGATSTLTEQELQDLVEYVLSL